MSHDIVALEEHRLRHDKTMDRLAEILAKREDIEAGVEAQVNTAQLEMATMSRMILELIAFQKTFGTENGEDGFWISPVNLGSFLRPRRRDLWRFEAIIEGNKDKDSRYSHQIKIDDHEECIAWSDEGEIFIRKMKTKKWVQRRIGLTYVGAKFTPWRLAEEAAVDWQGFRGGDFIESLRRSIARCEERVTRLSREAADRQDRVRNMNR